MRKFQPKPLKPGVDIGLKTPNPEGFLITPKTLGAIWILVRTVGGGPPNSVCQNLRIRFFFKLRIVPGVSHLMGFSFLKISLMYRWKTPQDCGVSIFMFQYICNNLVLCTQRRKSCHDQFQFLQRLVQPTGRLRHILGMSCQQK